MSVIGSWIACLMWVTTGKARKEHRIANFQMGPNWDKLSTSNYFPLFASRADTLGLPEGRFMEAEETPLQSIAFITRTAGPLALNCLHLYALLISQRTDTICLIS